MNILLRLPVCSLFVVSAALSAASLSTPHARRSPPGKRQQISFRDLKRSFKEPDMRYGPFTFWFWDCPMQQAQARGMAREMAQQHLNPGYAHARMSMVGTESLPRKQWLTDPWFERFTQALNEAEKAGCYFSYCDEYWWPSGRAAGRVLKEHPDLWAVSLKWETFTIEGGKKQQLPRSFFTVAAQLSGTNRPIPADELPAKADAQKRSPHTPAHILSSTLRVIGSGAPFAWQAPTVGAWRVYSFTRYYHPGIDGGRLNYLDRRLPETFIKLAHEPYAKRFPKKMGTVMPGVFVDNEGDYGYKLAWSHDLADHYEKKTGRDIRLWMPLLFDRDEEGAWARARWEWFEAVTDIYTGWLSSVSRWLEKRDMYCISNLWEESLMWQAGAVGDFFKAQRAYSMPGTDCLGLSALKVHDFKETQSVTEFEGRRFQSEIMGAAGWWGFKPEAIKKVANAITAWGVSHVVPHGIFMTRKLEGNPWLPDWYTENPMWRFLHLWFDFVRRNSFLNSHGRMAAEVLLLNPMDSVWALSGPGVFDPAFEGRVPVAAVLPLPSEKDVHQSREALKKNSAWWCPPKMQNWFPKKVHAINKTYCDAIETLTKHRIDFLIADRYYMDKMELKNSRLVFETFSFKTVVIPPMVLYPARSFAKILSFAEAGGRVYLLGSLPSGSTEKGMNDPVMQALTRKLVSLPSVTRCKGGVQQAIEKKKSGLVPRITFHSGAFDLIQQHRIIDGRHLFFLANNTGKTQKSTLHFSGVQGTASLWNSETGVVITLPSHATAGGSRLAFSFGPFEAFWVGFDPEEKPYKGNGTTLEAAEEVLMKCAGTWRVSIDPASQPSVSQPAVIPAAFTQPGGVEKPLASWSSWNLKSFSGLIDYTKTVKLEPPEGRMLLDLGTVLYMAEVWINGKSAGKRLWAPFVFDITGHIRPGENNTIRVRVGNLVNNSFGQHQKSGLLGPVLIRGR